MNRPERVDIERAAVIKPYGFPVEEGAVYELHVLLLADGPGPIVGTATVGFEFTDAEGHIIPPEYDYVGCAQPSRPFARSVPVEIFARALESPMAAADFFAVRLVVAPSRAIALEVRLPASAPFEVVRLDLNRIALAGPLTMRAGCRSLLAGAAAAIKRLQGGMPGGVRIDPAQLMRPIKDQLSSVRPAPSPFTWAGTVAGYSQLLAKERLDERRRLLPRERTFAFIGGERLYYKLSASALILLARDEAPLDCLDHKPDALVIETCVEGLLSSWRQQLCSAEGQLGASAAALVSKAEELGIPVRVVVTTAETTLYRELLSRADRILVEEPAPADDPILAALPAEKVERIPRSFERTVAAPVIEHTREGFRLLVPNASVLLGNEEYRQLVAGFDWQNLLLTEAFIDLSETQVAQLLPFSRSFLVASPRYLELLYHLQHAQLVLLFMDSPLSDTELQDLVLDANACGAVVLAFGDTARLGALAPFVTAVDAASRLFEMVALLSNVHHREQLWLSRYREISRAFAFESVADRLAGGEGRTPAPPLATVITATKRPEHSARILANFSRQAYPNKELVVVIHGVPDAPFPVPPVLASCVRVFHVPASVNLGFCLNEGIRHAGGDYWFKLDDDDYYGAEFISDMIDAHRCSGADIVGKPSYLIYLESADKTVCRPTRELQKRRHFRYQSDRPDRVPRLTGATLSARKGAAGPFSPRRRAGVDSEWTERMAIAGLILYCSDYLNFIVFRSADKSNHTWKLADERLKSTNFGSGITVHLT